LTSIPLIIQHYAERYEEQDKARTLAELEEQNGVPRIKIYGNIIGWSIIPFLFLKLNKACL